MQEVKFTIGLIDKASQGLSQLEQKIRQIQQRIHDDTKKLNQDSANSDKQSSDKKKQGWSELEAHIKRIQQKIADDAKKAAQDAADAEQRAKEQKKKGWSELEAHIKRIQQQIADDAKRKAEEAAAAAQQAKEKQKRSWSELEAHIKQIQQRIADDAKRKAEQTAEADRQAKEKQKNGWSQLEAHAKRIQQRIAEDAKFAAQFEIAANRRAMQEISQARQTLGARSHAQIQADMNAQRQAYQRLAQAGVLSFREQAQAADALRRHLTELTNETGRLTAAQRGMKGLGLAGAAVAGVGATAYAMKEPIKDAMDYDKRVADMVNIGFSDRDVKGRWQGKKELEVAIHKAVKESQGTISVYGATEMLETVLAGGRVPIKQAMDILPYLSKTSGANASNPQDIATTANVLYGQKYVTNNDELKRAFNMIIATGQASSFETKDQVRFLPEQLGQASVDGLLGLRGLRDVLTMNATSTLTNGTSDEAGVSTSNFLRKALSRDTAKDYANYMEDKHQVKGANLYAELDKAAAKGVNTMQWWQNFFDGEMKNDKRVQGYMAQLKGEKDPDKARVLESRINLVKGELIGEMFQEIRASKGVLGYQNTDYRSKIENTVDAARSGVFKPNETNFDFMTKQSYAKVGMMNNTLEAQKKHELDKVTPTLGNYAVKASNWFEKHTTSASLTSFAPQIGTGIGAFLGYRMLMGNSAATAGTGTGLLSKITTLISRIPSLSSNAGSYLSRGSTLVRTGLEAATPYAPLLARTSLVGTAGYAGYQLGNKVANPALDSLATKLTGHTASFGTAIHEFIHGESTFNAAIHNLMGWKPAPVQVDTHVTVALAPGMIPVSAKSTGTNSGTNTTTVGGKGNMFTGAPR